ncbi:hypothetical protein [Rhizobium lusitanum]|jgi:hypothetical protein|uniref:Uncharacterized protein n=1 Tax=Rhizobium lusitanum TaxID=293958 RepID=A0A1C3W028_9HYPH|nr:hypothetical protein [Rhizobium lusitanum]SCB33319.1 hypothetical protein GA0061101_107215 [Rhizobium lusitanum]
MPHLIVIAKSSKFLNPAENSHAFDISIAAPHKISGTVSVGVNLGSNFSLTGSPASHRALIKWTYATKKDNFY